MYHQRVPPSSLGRPEGNRAQKANLAFRELGNTRGTTGFLASDETLSRNKVLRGVSLWTENRPTVWRVATHFVSMGAKHWNY